MKPLFAALLSGLLFGIGLSLSHMVNPNKVQDFLDIFGHWDASLLLVMAGALPVTFAGFKWTLKKSTPLLADEFQLAKKTALDKPLIMGSIIFGIGWGLVGYCPGPAIAGLGLFSIESVVIVISICLGFLTYHFFFERS